MNVVAFSGGKDSTTLALMMQERGEDFVPLMNLTGDEMPDLIAHVLRVQDMLGRKIEYAVAGFSLHERIRHYEALPNGHMRWCTRELKIEPTIRWLVAHPGSTLCVGLRADEDDRTGLYGPYATYRRPLREYGMGLPEVQAYLARRGITVPDRTDCALCYGQRIGEWWRLWKEHPDLYAKGEALEALTGHTFRSATRDTWPAGLKELRERFEAGDVPTRGKYGIRPLPLFGEYDVGSRPNVCRVCSL